MARQEGTSYVTAGASRKAMALEGVLFQATVNQTTFNPNAGIVNPSGTQAAFLINLMTNPFTGLTSTYVIPAGLFNPPAGTQTAGGLTFISSVLKALRVTIWGGFTGTAGHRLRLNFVASVVATPATPTTTTILDTSSLTTTGTNWFVDAIITKLSNTSIEYVTLYNSTTVITAGGAPAGGLTSQVEGTVTSVVFGLPNSLNIVLDETSPDTAFVRGIQIEMMPEGQPEL